MLGLGLNITKNNNKKFRPINIVAYNPLTWAEWNLSGAGSTKGVNGVHLVSQGSTDMNIFATNCKPSTKYGLLYNVLETTLSSTFALAGTESIQISTTIIPKLIGNNKAIFTSIDLITFNNLRIICSTTNVDGEYINFKDIRMFELTQQLETDFTNLTADQLNIKYPF
jgi:hypothetical protein